MAQADDYRDYGPVVEVGLRPRYTHWSTMAFWEVCRPTTAAVVPKNNLDS